MLTQLLGGPGAWQTIPSFLPLGVPGNHRLRAERGVDPGNQLKSPVAGIREDEDTQKSIEVLAESLWQVLQLSGASALQAARKAA